MGTPDVRYKQREAAGTHSPDPLERRARLARLHDECKLAAEQSSSTLAGDEWRALTNEMLSVLDEFYKGITIT
jgi:hypothetical protein